MKRFLFIVACLFLVASARSQDQVFNPNIRTTKLYRLGDPVSFPFIMLGSTETLELHFDDCSVALPGAKVPPLATIVSGAAAKQRALNTAFMKHQDKRYPQMTTSWARGLVWGFAHLSLSGEEATVRFIETPDDGSGAAQTVHTARFPRRSNADQGVH